jgi:glycosyltransferase involved in cell wall biosynthesis
VTATPVSVALATYDGARHLGEQLRSILDQTHPVAEIVLADDGSRDGTVDLARSTVGDRMELRVVAEDRVGGAAANFQRALAAVRFPLVALSDQDDRWHPDRIARAVARFDGRPRLLLLHADAVLVDDAGAPLGSLLDAIEVSDAMRDRIHRGEAFDLLLRRNLVTGATAMLRRELVDAALPVPPGWVHDEWLGIVAAASDGVDLLDEALLDYRQHGANEIGARELSLAGKLGRMFEPGRERNDRLLVRARSLALRLGDAAGVPNERRAAIGRKLEHEERRSALSRHRLARLAPVLRGLRSGAYRDFGRGLPDAVRDLVQPLPITPQSTS